ncbi:MAG: c-type cytochrome [Proteobacteria bacterium]|nr:c-type cytochrome [Pseudomonadota bacterium]
MKIRYALLLAGVCLTGASAANASVDMAQGAALAKTHNCLACHAVDRKMVGPAYQDVAKKYKGDKEAVAMLVNKVKAGGKGVWGPIPMPANSPKVNDADIKTMVEWVLAL